MDDIKLDKLRGVAVGAAVGDALGMPLEFGSARSLDNLEREMIDGGLPAGSFTDDTELALALAESLLRASPLDPQDLAQRFVDWYHAEPADIGIHTSHVLGLVSRGMPWNRASRQVQAAHPISASNGSVMRCWPVAIRYWNSPDLLRSESRLQSRVTHRHADCVKACEFVNLLISELVSCEPAIPPGECLRRGIATTLACVKPGKVLFNAIRTAKEKPREDLPNSGFVRDTLQSTIWSLLNTDSFEEALVHAVNLGGDADTTGAVTGAVAGALYGLDAIPARWKTTLRGEYPLGSGRIWQVNDIITIADQLIEFSS